LPHSLQIALSPNGVSWSTPFVASRLLETTMGVIQAVKGTRDFYPEDMAFRTWLYATIRSVSDSFGFQEYDAPFLERLELYAAKSGEELVKEQTFVFPDRSGEYIALRPELTLGLARMVAARAKSLVLPLRWWSFGPFWRYERPQKGRTREFFQWNIDLLGPQSPETDAELAAVGAAFLRQIGLSPESVRILVNDRKLAESGLNGLGIPATLRSAVFRLIDRREKLAPAAWEAQAREIGLDSAQFSGLQRLLADTQAWKRSPDLVAFFQAAQALDASDYLAYDPTIIRGLDYYTGIVFEGRDAAGEHRSILGGGRYDNLVADVGGDPVGGMGFAMGDVVIGLVLAAYDALPSLQANPAQVLVATFDAATRTEALRLAAELRASGLRCEWYPEADKLQRQYKHADRQRVPFVALVGPDELAAGTVSIKDLARGTQATPRRQDAAAYLRSAIEGREPA
jgi:histidyl-tRNA synthetase